MRLHTATAWEGGAWVQLPVGESPHTMQYGGKVISHTLENFKLPLRFARDLTVLVFKHGKTVPVYFMAITFTPIDLISVSGSC